MTAETLKPFLNLPNATANDLKAHCAQRTAVKRCLWALGCLLVVALCCAMIGVQIWHLDKTAALQREVDDLKLQLYLRTGEFSDYPFDNELFENHDEYDTGYEPDLLDPDVVEDGRGGRELETSELLESGLTSSGMHSEDEEGNGTDNDEEEDDDDDGNLGIENLRQFGVPYDVSVADVGGKRRARSISGVTRQGVPIVDEPYVPRRNRTRHVHRIFEQMRQRPEELVTPPTTDEMFRWDMASRKSHASSQQQQSYGSISIRPYHHGSQAIREQYSTTPMPVYGSHTGSKHHSRNELTSSNPTKPPAQVFTRMSRVQATGESVRGRLQDGQRFPKVVGNPGTQKEIVMAPEARVRSRHRKAGAVNQSGADPLAKGVHLVKQYVHGMHHRNTRHRDWVAKDEFSKQAAASRTFGFDGEQLTIKEPGLYYIYAQITYDNEHDVNGFKVLVGGHKQLSCTVHAQGENTNACYTGGLAEIANPGTTVAIDDVDHGRHHVMYPEKTFFGAFRVGRLPSTASVANHRMARKVV